MQIKMHADEFKSSNGAALAVEVGAVSADHLGAITDDGILSLSGSPVVATLLPSTLFMLGETQYAPARKLIESGAAVALASDFNPGTSATFNMQFVLTLACSQMRMTPAEAIVAATINGKAQYVIFTSQALKGVDTATGSVLWSFPWKTGAECNAATPLVMGNSIFIATGYGHGCAMVDITPEGAKSRWENKEIQAHFSSPIFSGGYIYGTGDPGVLACLDPATGKALWRKEGFEKGGIAAVDGTILALDGAGGDLVMAAIAPDAYKELGRLTPLGGQSWTAPIVANGKLIVRNKTTLACYSLK
jgi:hypothetical protein